MLAGLVALVVGQSSGLVAAARDQLSWGTVYDPAYVRWVTTCSGWCTKTRGGIGRRTR
jgi:uncharacterized protein YijF (DUF1287 family)